MTLLPAERLTDSPFVPSVCQVINEAYERAYNRFAAAKGDYTSRLAHHDDFLSFLSEVPDTFVLILHRPGRQDATLGTITCRPYLHVPADLTSPWHRRVGPTPGCLEWELKLLAVDPPLQRQGIAQWLVVEAEREAVRRARLVVGGNDANNASSAAAEVAGGAATAAAPMQETSSPRRSDGRRPLDRRVRVVLTTLKEVMLPFYQRLGYQVDYEIPRGNGFTGNIIGLSKTVAEL